MALQARHVWTRLLLILALVTALLAGLVAVYWVTSQGGSSHAITKACGNSLTCLKTGSLGGDSGGGKIRTASADGHGGGSLRTASISGPLGNGDGGGK
jgi:hypothetical protein